MLPVFVPLNVVTASVTVCFWYQWWLHSWPLITDVFLMVYHHNTLLPSGSSILRKLMGSIWEGGWPSSPNYQSISSNIYSFKILAQNFHYLSAWKVEVPNHVIATLLMLQEHPLNTKVINLTDNFFNMELLNIAWCVVQSGYCPVLYTTC